MGIYDLTTVPGDNTTVGDVGVQEGMNPGLVNNAIRGLSADLKKWANDIGGAKVAGGSANVLTLSTDSGIVNYGDGYMFSFVAAAANTASATISIDGVGAKAIRKGGDVALSGGELVAGGHYLIQYDASASGGAGAFFLLNPTVTGDMANQDADDVDISGGEIDGTPIGANSASTGAFTSLSLSGDVVVDDTDFRIYPNTTDGSDDARLALIGGGSFSSSRGGYAYICGNEHATTPGAVLITAGNVAGAGMTLNGVNSISLAVGTEVLGLSSGAATFTGTLTASGTATFGTVDINGGAIDGTTIGANSAAAGSFTQVTVVGSAPVISFSDTDDSVTGQIGSGTSDFNIASNVPIDVRPDNVRAGFISGTQWLFYTSSSERMRIDSSGNLAIGKTTATEKLDVNGTVNATGFKLNGTALPITVSSGPSTPTNPTASTEITFAHGLGVTPKIVVATIECTSADAGYSVGEILELPLFGYSSYGLNATRDSTNVVVRVGSQGLIFPINGSSGFAATAIDESKWEMTLEAFA